MTGKRDGNKWLVSLGVPAGFVAAFLALAIPFRDFVLDDAYITYRYGKHLAEGHGIVWNIGADPVEGGSSMLWTLLSAIPHMLDIPAPGFAQAVGILAGIASAVLVWFLARRWGAGPSAAAAGVAIVALNPAFVFVSLQGLETSTAAFLALLAGAGAVVAARDPTHARLAGTMLALLACMLTRPDLALFAAGVLVAGGWQLNQRHGASAVHRAGAWLLGGLIVPGLAYFVWRATYFGHLFPNTFYVKQGGSPSSLFNSAHLLGTFLVLVLGPLLALSLWRLARDDEAVTRLLGLAPLVAGVGLFLPGWLLFDPIQGFLWRFQMPALPAGALAMAVIVQRIPAPRRLRSLSTVEGWRSLGALALVLMLLFSPLHTFMTVGDEYLARHQGDRPIAGQALAEVQGDEPPRMFVSESGALPYYSGWVAVDKIGLNNESIAHEKLSTEFLQAYDPHLVMLLSRWSPDSLENRHPLVVDFLESEGYELAAAFNKSHNPNKVHYYFVDGETSISESAACLLQAAPTGQADPAKVQRWQGLDVGVANPPPSAC